MPFLRQRNDLGQQATEGTSECLREHTLSELNVVCQYLCVVLGPAFRVKLPSFWEYEHFFLEGICSRQGIDKNLYII